MNIKVTIKNVYGNELVYPACETSSLLAKLLHTKTFTPQAIEIIKKLGYTLEVLTPILH